MPINPLDVGYTTTKEYRQDKKEKGNLCYNGNKTSIPMSAYRREIRPR